MKTLIIKSCFDFKERYTHAHKEKRYCTQQLNKTKHLHTIMMMMTVFVDNLMMMMMGCCCCCCCYCYRRLVAGIVTSAAALLLLYIYFCGGHHRHRNKFKISSTKKHFLFSSIIKRNDDLRLPVVHILDGGDTHSVGKKAAKTPKKTNEPPLLPSPPSSSSSSSNSNNNTDIIITAINDVDNSNDIEEPPQSSDSVLSQGTVTPGSERSEDDSGSAGRKLMRMSTGKPTASTSSTRYPNNNNAGADLASLRAEKRKLHQMLRSSYGRGFLREHRRQVSSFVDIKPVVVAQYRRHREMKWQIVTRGNKYKKDGDDTATGKSFSMQEDHADYYILKEENIDDKLLLDAIRKGEMEGKRTNAAMQIERAWNIFLRSNHLMPRKDALSKSRNRKDDKGKMDEDIFNNPATESPNDEVESPSPVVALPLALTELPQNFPTSNLERHMKNLTTYSLEDLMAAKRDVTATLKEYDRNFCRRHGRYPKKAEKEPIRCFYEAYYEIKAQILFLEIVQKEFPTPNKGSPPEGMDDDYILLMLKKEKKTVHGVLRAFEKKFCEENGRQVSSSLDIQPYNEQYNRYIRLKKLIADRAMKKMTAAVAAAADSKATTAGGNPPDTSAGG